jgi:hypothetical protein
MNGKQSPILELRDDVLLNPSRLDLAEIESLMLFPNSVEKRCQCYISALIEFAAQNPDQIPKSEWKELFFLSRDAFPIKSLQDETKNLIVKGAIVGFVLHQQIAYSLLGKDDIPKYVIAEEAMKIYKKKSSGGYLRISKSSFNDAWAKFGSVAHFWAAWVALTTGISWPQGAFPCRLDCLGKFFSDAEAFRIAGERITPKHANSTILDETTTVRLPAGLSVIPSSLEFEPITAS